MVDVAVSTAVMLGAVFAAGFAVRGVYHRWRHGSPYDQYETIRNGITHKYVAEAAIERLDEDEKRAIQDEVTEKMEASFGEGSRLEYTDDMNDME